LSWLTILKRREGFRSAFEGFEVDVVAQFDELKIASLMQNPEIIKNRAKILSAVKNARVVLDRPQVLSPTP
jgi:DNA-3-methyladenine glycosylase I